MGRWRVLATDTAITAAAFIAASYLRWGEGWAAAWRDTLPQPYLALLLHAAGVVALYWFSGLGRRTLEWSLLTDVRDVARTMSLLAIVSLASLFAAQAGGVSRLVVGFYVALTTTGLLGARVLAHALANRPNRSGSRRLLLLVGSGPEAKEFISQVAEHPELNFEVVGFVDDGLGSLDGFPRLGDSSELEQVLAHHVVADVAICLPRGSWSEVDALAAVCQEQGKMVHIPLTFMQYAFNHGSVERVGDTSVLSLTTSPYTPVALAAKRAIDIIGATLMLVLTMPITASAAVLIAAVDGRPVLFRQQRAGLHGKPFNVLKFRTMRQNAEEEKLSLMDQNERRGHVFKMTDDPRVTRIGRLLRRSSIDELPQLVNVLRGDMSLVGPRPPEVVEVKDYDAWHRRRLSMRPGITGLWQVTARDEPDFDRWVEVDLEYIDTWSLLSDLRILLKTPGALFRTPGA